ncbi:MAG: helix-turn-helix domain-containing protein [Flavobacteriales bacterium]|nr:helix-turn-helix domain-containing protein [Flavobacteriales bacterium]
MKADVILDKIKEHYVISTDSELASFLEISKQGISNWRSRDAINIKRIYKKCKGISMDWLLTGKGDMFLKQVKSNFKK